MVLEWQGLSMEERVLGTAGAGCILDSRSVEKKTSWLVLGTGQMEKEIVGCVQVLLFSSLDKNYMRSGQQVNEESRGRASRLPHLLIFCNPG